MNNMDMIVWAVAVLVAVGLSLIVLQAVKSFRAKPLTWPLTEIDVPKLEVEACALTQNIIKCYEQLETRYAHYLQSPGDFSYQRVVEQLRQLNDFSNYPDLTLKKALIKEGSERGRALLFYLRPSLMLHDSQNFLASLPKALKSLVTHGPKAMNLLNTKQWGELVNCLQNIPANERVLFELDGANFAGANLQGADLRYYRFEAADFKSANLTGACLSYSNLHQANFFNANLIDCDFRLTRGIDTLLSVSHAVMDGHVFALLVAAKWANFTGVVFTGEINKMTLSRLNFRACDFSNAELTEVDFSGANLARAVFNKPLLHCNTQHIKLSINPIMQALERKIIKRLTSKSAKSQIMGAELSEQYQLMLERFIRCGRQNSIPEDAAPWYDLGAGDLPGIKQVVDAYDKKKCAKKSPVMQSFLNQALATSWALTTFAHSRKTNESKKEQDDLALNV